MRCLHRQLPIKLLSFRSLVFSVLTLLLNFRNQSANDVVHSVFSESINNKDKHELVGFVKQENEKV